MYLSLMICLLQVLRQVVYSNQKPAYYLNRNNIYIFVYKNRQIEYFFFLSVEPFYAQEGFWLSSLIMQPCTENSVNYTQFCSFVFVKFRIHNKMPCTFGRQYLSSVLKFCADLRFICSCYCLLVNEDIISNLVVVLF